jgi:adenylate cyclase
VAIEIERRFLVAGDSWRADVIRETPIKQGYFSRTSLLRARIRIFGDQGFVTFKSEGATSEAGSLMRHEFEYEIPKADAVEMIRRFSIEPLISKRRYDVMYEGKMWSIDVFEGANKGLVLAEVELTTSDEVISVPRWAVKEVTGDARYGNSSLARFPFLSWDEEAAAA